MVRDGHLAASADRADIVAQTIAQLPDPNFHAKIVARFDVIVVATLPTWTLRRFDPLKPGCIRQVTNVTHAASTGMFGWSRGCGYREPVRRTVDFALDTEQMIRHRMATRGISFEQAVNDSIRQGFDRGVLEGTVAGRSRGDQGGSADR